MHLVFFTSLALISIVSCTSFSDIISGIFNASSFSDLANTLPPSFVSDLESNENDAGLFVCQVLHGDVPTILSDIPGNISVQVSSGVAALTNFIDTLPTAPAAVLNDIEQGGQAAADAVSQFAENPNDIFSIVGAAESSLVSFAQGVASDVGCFESSCGTFTVDPSSTQPGFTSDCSSILVNHQYQYTGVGAAVITSSATPTATSNASPSSSITATATITSTQTQQNTATVTVSSSATASQTSQASGLTGGTPFGIFTLLWPLGCIFGFMILL